MRRLLLTTAFAALSSTAGAEVPKVVTDVPVTQSLVAAVMGALGAPGVLVASGGDPHDYQLRPSQARALAGADAIFWIGRDLTPWLEPAVEASGAADRVALLDTPGTHLRDYAEAGDADAGGDHAHVGHDPHAWLDPDNARAWLATIAGTLAARDPDHADSYRANADAAAGRIERLDADLRARTQVVTGGIVVSHDAYGYLAEHYGLNVVASLSGGDAAPSGAAHLSAVRALLESGQAACIFPETGHDPKAVTTLAEGTGVMTGDALDPAGTGLEPGAGLYEALLTGLVEKIARCAG